MHCYSRDPVLDTRFARDKGEDGMIANKTDALIVIHEQEAQIKELKREVECDEQRVADLMTQVGDLAKERDGLAAKIERVEKFAVKVTVVMGGPCDVMDNECEQCQLYTEAALIMSDAPLVSLKLHDADVLMDLAGSITDPALWLGDDMFNHILEEAGRLREEAEQ